MNKFAIIMLGIVAILVAIVGSVFFSKQAAAPENKNIEPIKTINTNMTITSPNFQEKSFIPKKFTCQGENVNPELRFGAVPEQAKSLALIMDDPDAPMGTFTHWLVWNIAPKTFLISERSVPNGAVEGKNDTGKIGHIGPCPPSGTHRYFFKLYALDAMLDLSSDASKIQLESEIQKHLIASAELVGLYKKE